MNTPISVPSAVEKARRYVKANDDLAARFGGIKGRFVDGVALTPELIELSAALLTACEALEAWWRLSLVISSAVSIDQPTFSASVDKAITKTRAALSCSAPPSEKQGG